MSQVMEWPEGRKVGGPLVVGIALLPIVFAWFLLRRGYSRLVRLLGFGWMLVFCLLLATAGGEGDIGQEAMAPESPSVARLKAIKNIPSVDDASEADPVTGLPQLWLTINKTSAWSEKQWVESCGMSTESALKSVVKQFGAAYSKVLIECTMPVQDQYGNTSIEKGMVLTFDMSDLNKVNWRNSSLWLLFNLSTADFTPLGMKNYRAFCADPTNGSYAESFCRQLDGVE